MNPGDPVEILAATPLGELAALEWRDADAAPLIALHGWLDNAASFVRLAPLLAPTRRVIALDLPGHGHSAHLPEAARHYHIVDQVEYVLAFADALGLASFDLLGHSMGAGIAALTAAATPARVTRLALIEGLGPLADDASTTLEHWQRACAPRPPRRRTARAFASIDAAVAARVAVGGLDAAEARPMVERNLASTDHGWTWRSDRRLRLRTPIRIEEQQVRRLLAGITAPTMLVLAEPAAPYLPTPTMEARAACVADIRIEHLAGPHHLHLRKPHEVAVLVERFLQQGRRNRPRQAAIGGPYPRYPP